ncbi:MAG: hypothetical protein AB7E09_05310, partial [Candidatus Izemoplasmatales bacterium]
MKRKIKILDKMVKSNSILVGLSLLVLITFIAFLSNCFSFQDALVESRFYQEYLNLLNKQSLDIFVIILIP